MTGPWITAILAGGSLALLSGLHCLLMCGPLAVAAQGTGKSSAYRYLLGRLTSYTVLGGIFGSIGESLLSTRFARHIEAALALMLALVLLHSALRFLGFLKPVSVIKLGRGPRTQRIGRILAHVAHDPLLLGVATALLPCGALYAALLASTALGSASSAALAMATFALVTSPALLGAAQLHRLTQLGARGRRALGVVLLVGFGVMLLRPVAALSSNDDAVPACHRGMGAH